MPALPLPRIEHPTDRPNFTRVTVGEVEIYYSYKTPIAFWSREMARYIVRKNDWGPTTGKHLSYIDCGQKDSRVDGATFERLLNATLDLHVIEEEPV
jgi:hypothetical protein